jgi:hypothetical protein
MSAFADRRNNIYVLFRAATETVHRDMYLLYSNDRGATFRGTDISPWNIGACTMSLEDLSEGPAGVLAAWETMGNVYYGVVDPSSGSMSSRIAAPGEAKSRRFPSVAGNSRGETLVAWAEGMKWGKGGSIAWQVFNKHGEAEGASGRADGVPPWSLVAAFAWPDGRFTVMD